MLYPLNLTKTLLQIRGICAGSATAPAVVRFPDPNFTEIGPGSLIASPGASQSGIDDEAPVSFDVTSIVSSWAGGQPPHGFGIINQSDDGWDYQVEQSGNMFSPRLVVEYEGGQVMPPAPAPIPLPASALLLLGAVGGLAAVRRKRG